MATQINNYLSKFVTLACSYNLGSEKSYLGGHLEKCILQRRPTLVPVFLQGKKLPLGPPTAELLAEQASSCEESEVEITDLLISDSKTIQDRTIADSKGGPRMKHVVDQIVDFQFLKTTVSNSPLTYIG
jgi:hypothetical protein